MSDTFEQIVERGLGALSEKEKARSAVYLDRRMIPKGEPVEINRTEMPCPFDAAMVFIDFDPQLNWGHPCAYLFIGTDPADFLRIDAEFPPFFKSPSPTLEVIWKGESVPAWTLAV